jgi:hypothetical protein
MIELPDTARSSQFSTKEEQPARAKPQWDCEARGQERPACWSDFLFETWVPGIHLPTYMLNNQI